MSDFINYTPMTGVTIDSYRKPEGSFNDDVRGLVDDVRAGRPGCCDLDGALAALEDGSLWTDEDQEAIESVHAAIKDFEREASAEA